MSFRNIMYIIVAVILITFIAVNLNNTSDISFVFTTLEDVPVFFTVFISILIGVLIMLPMTLTARAASPKKPKKEKKRKKSTTEDEIASIEAMLEDQPDLEPKKAKKRNKKEKYGEPESVSDMDIRE